MQKPSTGRIVHYQLREGAARPLLVTSVTDQSGCDLVSGQVFLDPGSDQDEIALAGRPTKLVTRVELGEPGQPGRWSWPQIVKPGTDKIERSAGLTSADRAQDREILNAPKGAVENTEKGESARAY